MLWAEAPIVGAWIIEPERIVDDRGFFARTFCARALGERGLETRFEQCSISFNQRRGTLRGLHWQAAPHGEAKLIRCTMGAVYDVIVDIRPASPSFRRSFSIELTAENRTQLYVPPGVAHGFQTLSDECEIYYQISESYSPEGARGARWNDPVFGIAWPMPPSVISERDAGYADFES